MTTCILGFAAAFFLAVMLTQGVRGLAFRIGAVDAPDNYRKLHDRPIPKLGGLALYGAFLLALVLIYLLNPYVVSFALRGHHTEALGCLLGAAVALGLGVWDDLHSVRPRTKLLLQLIPATVAFATGCSIGTISLPFLGSVNLGLLSFPITLFWFLSCMNAVNFLDGLDGLASGVTLFVALTLFLVGIIFDNVFSMILMACLSGAILGFLIFNFHPAKIFLGDSGSMLLGFLIAALSLLASRKAETTVALLIPVIALGLPIMDTSLAILRRWSRKLPIETADRQHIHHLLVHMGLSHRRTVLSLYTVCLVLGISALLITLERSELTISVLGVLGVTAFVCIRVFGRVRLSTLFARVASERQSRQRASSATVAAERAQQVMHNEKTADEVWTAYTQALEDLGLDEAHLLLNRAGNDAPVEFQWSQNRSGDGRDPSREDLWLARLAWPKSEAGWTGTLEVVRRTSEGPLPEPAPALIHKLRDELARHLEPLLESTAADPPEHSASTGTSTPASVVETHG